LTSYSLTKPLKPPGFCMALRKYLRNGRIAEVRQHEFERIVIITVKREGSEYQLVSELFGEGNIILVGPENEIVQALGYRRMRDRNVVRKERFMHPPSIGRNPVNLRREDLDQIRDFGQLSIVKASTRFMSIGGPYAEEILLRAGVDKNTPCKDLKDEDIDSIFAQLRGLILEIVERKAEPRVFVDEQSRWIDVAPIPLRRYAHLKCVAYETLNKALDEYYARTMAQEGVGEVEKRAEQELERLNAALRDQRKAIEDRSKESDLYRKVGDIVYRHLNELEFLIQNIMDEKRSGESWEKITAKLETEKADLRSPAIYFVSLVPQTMTLQVSVEDQIFQLNLKETIQDNASQFYERAKRAERKLIGAKRAMEQTQLKIEQLKNRMIDEREKAAKLSLTGPKREWYGKFHWFYSSDGFLVIGGRDASTNEVLIRRYMTPEDVVFHADAPGAPFVLIKTDRKQPTDQTIREAAQLAGSYSRAWKEMLTTTNVYWVSPEQVSKRPPSGEYLPKGAFMIYGKRNYVRNVPVKVAIGIEKENHLSVIGGPVEAIAKQAHVYVGIVPGENASGKLAKEIRYRLAQTLLNTEREEILKIPLEEIQRFIPLGRGNLAETSQATAFPTTLSSRRERYGKGTLTCQNRGDTKVSSAT